ncbi:MAG: sigma-70 family RNA polymerase sigma factor [Oscillospiraceae bacterium]|nr:sigma-70 family RNA polymerase sigma factor [Oscillospiraceae bacterium]
MIYLSALDTEPERQKFAELYEAHKRALFWKAMQVTHNQEMAEDAVHNAFLAIIEHKEKMFSLSGGNFRSWCVIIVKNKAIDLLRRESHFAELPERAPESNDAPIETQIITRDDYAQMREQLEKLDETSGQVLKMKYILDMSYKEIGEALGMTSRQIDGCIARAKEKIRKQLGKEVSRDES